MQGGLFNAFCASGAGESLPAGAACNQYVRWSCGSATAQLSFDEYCHLMQCNVALCPAVSARIHEHSVHACARMLSTTRACRADSASVVAGDGMWEGCHWGWQWLSAIAIAALETRHAIAASPALAHNHGQMAEIVFDASCALASGALPPSRAPAAQGKLSSCCDM